MPNRRLLTQVQFCLPGLSHPCNGAGQFFTADMVFLKLDDEGDIVDMIIGEIKLSRGTKLSDGQELAAAAAGSGSLSVRSVDIFADELGQGLELEQGAEIMNVNFIKIFSDGQGEFDKITATVY